MADLPSLGVGGLEQLRELKGHLRKVKCYFQL